MLAENIKVGDTVYFFDKWSACCVSGLVKEIKENSTFCNCKEYLYRDGTVMDPAYGSCYVPFENMFKSPEEAYAAKDKEKNESVDKYCNQIKTERDLVVFALTECLNGEEYTDYSARAAFVKRANELLHVDVDLENVN